jgi:hypothetical protein
MTVTLCEPTLVLSEVRRDIRPVDALIDSSVVERGVLFGSTGVEEIE